MSNRVVIQPHVSRDVYFPFKKLCHSHGVAVERAIDELMREALARSGVGTSDEAHSDERASQVSQHTV